MKVSFWTYEINNNKHANIQMHDSWNLHVLANVQIWICIEMLMMIKGISDYASQVGGVNEMFVITRVGALVYWILGFLILKRFPRLVTKALALYHVLLSLSIIMMSQKICGVKNGGSIAYEMITRTYLLLYVVIMVLLNSNYVFT